MAKKARRQTGHREAGDREAHVKPPFSHLCREDDSQENAR